MLRKNTLSKIHHEKYRVLECVLELRSSNYELNKPHRDRVDENELINHLYGGDLEGSYKYKQFIKPYLESFEAQGALEITPLGIELKSMAWNLVSNYYVDERRHKDNQNSLLWQRWITGFIAIGSIGNLLLVIYLTFSRG